MKQFIIFISIVSVLWSCREEDPLSFSKEKASVYFYINYDINTNYISKSFGATLDSQIVVTVPVMCSGLASPADRYFKIEVDRNLSTAKAGIDFIMPDSLQLFPANSYTSSLKIVVLNTTTIKDSTLEIRLRLKPNNDFVLGEIKRLEAVVKFTDGLTKPTNWDEAYLKVYSKVKHKIFLLITKSDEYPTPQMYSSRSQYYKYLVPKEVSAYLKKHFPVYDENGNIIQPW